MTLRRAARRISQAYDEALAGVGLRATQYSVLTLLRGMGSQNINVLADRMDLDRTTMGKNLRPLERAGFVSVQMDEQDRRGRTVSLTVEGARVCAAAYPLWLEAQTNFEKLNGRKRMRGLRSELNQLHI